MQDFKKLVEITDAAKVHADKYYIKGNKSAGERLFKCLMLVTRQAKIARKELSIARNKKLPIVPTPFSNRLKSSHIYKT